MFLNSFPWRYKKSSSNGSKRRTNKHYQLQCIQYLKWVFVIMFLSTNECVRKMPGLWCKCFVPSIIITNTIVWVWLYRTKFWSSRCVYVLHDYCFLNGLFCQGTLKLDPIDIVCNISFCPLAHIYIIRNFDKKQGTCLSRAFIH